MATNPFENEDARYSVVINNEGQYSLWPTFAAVPAGWDVVFGEHGRQECLSFVEKNWTDMRPKSLIADMEARAPSSHPAGRPPRNAAEATLCRLFAAMLNVPAVSIDDDFFALGGRSLQVIVLLEQIHAELGLEIKARSFFVAPTVAGLAERLGVSQSGGI